MSAPNYQASGEENLRANETFRKTHSAPASPGGGKPMGGEENLRADYKCIENPGTRTTPAKGSGPSIPQHFNDSSV